MNLKGVVAASMEFTKQRKYRTDGNARNGVVREFCHEGNTKSGARAAQKANTQKLKPDNDRLNQISSSSEQFTR